jgi:endonuclease/exonuclease/phosphatase family metal-dependent hydrolase
MIGSVQMTIEVASINIWNRFGPWEERLPRLREGLRALAPDVVGLQEVLVVKDAGFDQNALLTDGLGYHHAWGCHSKSPHPVGNAIFSRFPVKSQAVFDLPQGGTHEHRCVVHARLASPHGELFVFVTHLNWKLDEGHVRTEQVKALVSIIDANAPRAEFPAIVMGDFNAEPDSDEIRYMRGLTGLGGKCVYFADCFGAAGDGSPGTTFSRDNPFALVCREPNRRIDYVFTRGPDERGRGEPLASRVCMNTMTNGGFPSDHFGVWAKLSTS